MLVEAAAMEAKGVFQAFVCKFSSLLTVRVFFFFVGLSSSWFFVKKENFEKRGDN